MLTFAALAAVAVPAAGQPLDPEYPERATAQRERIERRVQRLVWPALTAPALARQGGRFELLLLWTRADQPAPERWLVTLGASMGEARRCRVRAVRRSRVGAGLLELQVEVPAELARDVYHLRVVGPGIDDVQPNAVRIFGVDWPATYRFAVLADHQIWDPSYRLGGRELNGGAYPRSDKEARSLSITRQGLAELALLDPEFVLHPGDLAFGLDYHAEYAQIRDLLVEARLPIFAVPGNHDGYADYAVRLRGGAARLVAGALGCRRHLQGELAWGSAWAFITCLYGDIKHLLFTDLHRDGLAHWRRQLGPPAYSFEHGRLRFVALNTFDGTPERRHAFSFYLDVFDLKLGAPAVDNFGGYLGDEQLQFLRREAAAARRRGQGLVVLGHHDPRGNLDGTRYHANHPFPTDPLALGGFEEWNYDSADWDSDPRDRRGAETAERNSAIELLRILAESGGYYLSGHRHQDQRTVFEPGSRLGPFRVQRRLEFIRTTSAASMVREGSYWGYRLIEVRGDRLEAVDYAPSQNLASVPAGNLWLERRSPDELALRTSLPLPTPVTVVWSLLGRAEGYRFKAPHAVRVLDVTSAGGRSIYRLGLVLPAAGRFPPLEGAPPPIPLRAAPAAGNRPPSARLEATELGGRPVPAGATLRTRVGQPLLLSAERSTDPDGDRIVTYLWDLGEDRSARGPRLAHTFSSPGRRSIALTLVDEAGARSRVVVEVSVEPRAAGGCAGCCASPAGEGSLAAGALPLLLMLVVRQLDRDRSRRRERRPRR
jgi:3',5'-cyclic AMP phosphodiesterase CpdA